jgi:hypothetical protein
MWMCVIESEGERSETAVAAAAGVSFGVSFATLDVVVCPMNGGVGSKLGGWFAGVGLGMGRS